MSTYGLEQNLLRLKACIPDEAVGIFIATHFLIY